MYGGTYGVDKAFILNRLLTSTVTDGTNTVTLASNTWGSCVNATPLPGLTLQGLQPGDANGPIAGLCQATTPGQVRNYQYDVGGNLIYTDDGTSAHSVSATMSSTTNYAAPSAITTASSLATSLNWSTFFAPTQSTGPNGDVNSTTYDSTTGRPKNSTGPYGAITNYTYSNNAPQVTATTNGHWTKTYLDGLGRTYEVDTGYGSTTVSSINTVYETCGCTPLGKPYWTSTPASAPSQPGLWPAYTKNTTPSAVR